MSRITFPGAHSPIFFHSPTMKLLCSICGNPATYFNRFPIPKDCTSTVGYTVYCEEHMQEIEKQEGDKIELIK